MKLIRGQGINHGVNQGINYDGNVIHKRTASEYYNIDHDSDLSHAEGRIDARKVHAQDILSAAGASVDQREGGSGPADHSSDEGGGEGVLYKRLCRSLYQCQEYRHGSDTDDTAPEKELSQFFVCQYEKRDVDHIVYDTRDIHAYHVEVEEADEKGSDQLTDSHKAAAVQSQGDYEYIHANGVEKGACNCQNQFLVGFHDCMYLVIMSKNIFCVFGLLCINQFPMRNPYRSGSSSSNIHWLKPVI